MLKNGKASILEKRVIFSILYSESDEFLPKLIENILFFTPQDVYFVINLPPNRTIRIEPGWQSTRVFVINGAMARHKFGHTLLVGHLESFDYAIRELGEFEFFCPLASNSLFFRHFDIKTVIAHLEASRGTGLVSLDYLPEHWLWKNIKQNVEFITFLRNRWGLLEISNNQIEGLFAARDDWGLLHSRMTEIAEAGLTIGLDISFPLEEILPSTFFNNWGSKHFVYICHMYWDRYKMSGGLARIEDFVHTQPEIGGHVCTMKWFAREPGSVHTAAVTQDWSLRLLSLLQTMFTAEKGSELLTQRMVLESFATLLRKRETFVPVSQRWWNEIEEGLRRWEFSAARLRAIRQLLPLGGADIGLADPGSAYLFMENTGHDIGLHVRLEQDGGTRVWIECCTLQNGDGAFQAQAEDEPVLEGYLYLSPRFEVGDGTFRLRVPLPNTILKQYVASHIVFAHAGIYKKVTEQYSAEVGSFIEYYYQNEAKLNGGEMWFGIPIYSGLIFEALVDAMLLSRPH